VEFCHPLLKTCVTLLWKGVSPLYKTVSPFCEMVFRPCVKRCVNLLWKDASLLYKIVSPFCEMVFRPCVKICVTPLWNGVSHFSQTFTAFKAQLVLHAPPGLTLTLTTLSTHHILCLSACSQNQHRLLPYIFQWSQSGTKWGIINNVYSRVKRDITGLETSYFSTKRQKENYFKQLSVKL
jgi:hypothetical protein